MKRFFFTLAFLAVVACVSAQSLRFELDGTVYPDGATIECTNDEYGIGEFVQHMQIRNLTSDEINVLVAKEVIEDLEGTMNYFCWGSCLSPDVFVSPRAVPVAANSLNTDDLSFHVMFEEGIFGKVQIRFSAYDENHPDDPIYINVIFKKSGTSVNEVVSQMGHAYPNPASSVVRFNYQLSGSDNARVAVYNLLGQEVMSRQLNSLQGQVSISVADLNEGIYFCKLCVNGKSVQTEKFVVKK